VAYTGEVTVGGAPDTRDLPGLTVTKVAVGPMDNNAYLLRCTATGSIVLIDAANEADRLLELIGDGPVSSIVTTHRHWDHWQALAEVQSATGAVVIAHPDDAEELPVTPASLVRSGDKVVVGATTHLGQPPAGPHRWQHRAVLRRGGRSRADAAPVHRRLPVPRRPG
jgi:glyoxylase-like metal-dependent hydrolase (beta-lactamase superfamily II)